MRYNQFGRSGLFVSELCLGAMPFGGRGFWAVAGKLGQEEADKLVARSLEAGINFIDTADVYGNGASEEITGKALRNLGVKRSDIIVATKVYNEVGPQPNDRGASRAHIMDGAKASLQRLGMDYIDLYQIHAFDPVTPLEETLRALEDLVRDGLVRYFGISNWLAWQIMKAIGISERHGWTRLDSVQAYYSLVSRDIEREVIPLLEDQHVALMVWSPLAGGLLSGKFYRGQKGPPGARRSTAFDFPPVDKERLWDVLDVIRPIAEAHGVSPARVAIAWLLSRKVVSTVIIGAKTIEQLDDNLESTELVLTADQLASLDKVSALTPEYPGWMVHRMAANRRPPPKRTRLSSARE
ncbi:MAG: aldo/keto reductase [Bryobacterales bacterium]|nr:aldo/keto reductase [Bryobacterales bacterium]